VRKSKKTQGSLQVGKAGVNLLGGEGATVAVGFQQGVNIAGLLHFKAKRRAGSVGNAGGREETFVVALQVRGGKFQHMVAPFVDGGEQLSVVHACLQADMAVGARTFGNFQKEVGFVLAETMLRKKFGVTPDIFVAGVEVEDDGLGGIKEFGQQAKLAVVGAKAFRS